MLAIELDHVSKSWGDTVAVDDMSFSVDESSFLVLLGPSGCGKSTTLRMIAGLEDVSDGVVKIGGNDVTNAPPAERKLSMVFQSYALFPHLSVKENILFGLKVRKVPASDQEQKLKRVSQIVGLADLLDRKPSQLSGGQRQRVALARAIIAENPICLMDEPLSNLDAKLRHDMRLEIRSLQQRLRMTVVYVTHDQAEAMSMADKVILIREGKIEQQGTPDELYDRPLTAFTAGFIGTPPMNLLSTRMTENGLSIGDENPTAVLRASSPMTFGVRPEHIEICETGGVSAMLISADYLGAETIVTAQVGADEVLVRVNGRVNVASPREGRLTWSPSHVHAFDAKTGIRSSSVEVLAV